jgi:hypothetical protein
MGDMKPVQTWNTFYAPYKKDPYKAYNDKAVMKVATLNPQGKPLSKDVAAFADAERSEFDTDGIKGLSRKEFEIPGILNGALTDQQLDSLFKVLDRNGDKTVDTAELAAYHMWQDQDADGDVTQPERSRAMFFALTKPNEAGQMLDQILEKSPIRERVADLEKEQAKAAK